MKKKINIDFMYWGYDKYNNFFTNFLKKHYHVVINENSPDYVFFGTQSINDTQAIRKISSKIFFLKKYTPVIRQLITKMPFIGRIFSDKIAMQEVKMPVLNTSAKRIFYSWAMSHADMDNTEFAFTEDYDEEMQNPRHLRLPWYKFFCNAGKELIKKNMNFDKIKKEKTKFCNFVYSNNAPFRNKFFKKLSKYKFIDSPGQCFHNIDAFEKTGWLGRYDWQEEKIEFLKKYKFTIAMETKDFLGYSSEKIYHAMIANSIPIYWGNRFINRDFNPKSFINYWDYHNEIESKIPKSLLKISFLNKLIVYSIIEPLAIKKMVKRIIEIDTDEEEYKKIISEPWFHDNKLSKYCDNNVYRKQFKKIFG